MCDESECNLCVTIKDRRPSFLCFVNNLFIFIAEKVYAFDTDWSLTNQNNYITINTM